MSKLSHYKAALYLCAAIAVTEAIWLVVFPRALVRGGFIVPALSFVIVLGLLLQSNFIRYIGALYMADAGTLAHQITRGRCRKGTRQVNDSGYFV